MNPVDLIPHAHDLALSPVWFSFFLTAVLVIHLLLMNTMLGSGIIALVSSFSKTDESRLWERESSRRLPFLIAFTINMGVPPLLFVQVLFGQYIYTSSILMAVYWICVVPALLLAYYAAYGYRACFDGKTVWLRRLLIGLSVAVLLYIAFAFSSNITLMQTPERWSRYFENPRGTLLNFDEATLVPRLLHFIIASVAVGGLFHALLSWFPAKKRSKASASLGLQWFTWATLIQVPVGLWFFFSLPPSIRTMFLGANLTMTTVLGLAVCCVLASLAAGLRGQPTATAVTAVLAVVLMVIVRGYVRLAYLAPFADTAQIAAPVAYSPLIMFLVSLAMGLGAMAYMLRKAFAGGGAAEA